MTWQQDLIEEAQKIWKRGWGHIRWGVTITKEEGRRVTMETSFSKVKEYKNVKIGETDPS